MRIKGAKQVHYDSGPNMTPLVDVVMVILIFLMLAGKFGGDEHYLISATPVTKTGGGASKDKVLPDDVQFTVTVDSPAQLNDRFVARAGDLQTSDMKVLSAALTKKKLQFNAAGTVTDKVQVIIAPGRNVKYKFLIDVYQAANDAEFTKVSFAPAH